MIPIIFYIMYSANFQLLGRRRSTFRQYFVDAFPPGYERRTLGDTEIEKRHRIAVVSICARAVSQEQQNSVSSKRTKFAVEPPNRLFGEVMHESNCLELDNERC